MPAANGALSDVQKTLFLPLWGRAEESRKAHPRLVDETAVRVVDSISYDFASLARNISHFSQANWVARCLHADRTIRQFLEFNPAATIVNLGCGLDTTFERVDNSRLTWYEMDLPEVIELRRRFIGESGRRRSIAGSLLDDAWMEQLNAAGAVFFLAMGVLYFFGVSQVQSTLCRLADFFPGSEILFDACSPAGVRIANKKVIRAGGLEKGALLKWGLKRAREIESWDRRISVLEEYPLFRGMKRSYGLRLKLGAMLADALHMTTMVRLRLGTPVERAEKISVTLEK
jgi:O-methyltransferase involved in polyketide biosynthesis